MWRAFSDAHKDEVPQILESLDLHGIAKYINSDVCQHVFIMAGAGISTSAGIPDFRSPDTGLYANLARLNLPYPEAVFDINFFRKNPRPFYTLAHELAPGRFRPTLTHSFIRLLAEKQLLHTCFTQNIDTLERRAGVPDSKIIEAHGSFAEQRCINCGTSFPDEKMKQMIEAHEIPHCGRKGCKGLVKPDIVFFGEALPPRFHKSVPHLRKADLLIVMGTSLTVHPFASLTELVPEDCPRLLINLDHVGGWGSRVNDVACLMRCDEAVQELCKILGWEAELDQFWATTAASVEKAPSSSPEVVDEAEGKSKEPTEAEKLKDEVDKLTSGVEKGLVLSEEKKEEVPVGEDSSAIGKGPEPDKLEDRKSLEKSEGQHGEESEKLEQASEVGEDQALKNEGPEVASNAAESGKL